MITQLQLNQLVQIYNTLTTISTKGEDTIIMAQCLSTLRPLLLQLQEQQKQQIDLKE